MTSVVLRGLSRAAVVSALMIGASCLSPVLAQDKVEAEVAHWWTSGGESAAVKVFADHFTKAGGTWKDAAVAGGQSSRSATINRIIGGNPPTAAQFNTGKQFDDLVSQGLLNPLDTAADEGKWKSFMPPAFVAAASRDGHFYAMPVNVHGQNWFFYSREALAKVGLTEPPKGWDELFAALDKMKAAGLVPLAQGGQPWQEWTLFTAVLASVDKDTYGKVLEGNDIEAVKSDKFRKAAEIFGRLRAYVDPGSPGRNWNDATALVITGKAGLQVMGDWAKGDFKAAGKSPGTDYFCEIGVDNSLLIIGGDVFIFPKTDDANSLKAQALLATSMLDPQTQVEFSIAKGSMPVRTDVDASKLDTCAQKGMKLVADTSRQVASGDMLISADLMGSLQDVVTNYWNNAKQTPDEFITNFADAITAAQ